MDIDEFLDRELSDTGLFTAETPQPEISADIPQFKEDTDTTSLFDSIKDNLSKGNLEQAEQAYVQLWHILLQQKLKWNKELYEQLSTLSRQFSSTLTQAYEEVKRKAQQVYELINKAKAALKEGKKEEPFKIYSQIHELNNSIPNVFFEEKKIIEEQIMDFYKELKNTTDNELLKRVFALIQEIYQLIDKINTAIRSNDIINAVVSYNKCIELYNQIPEGFLRHKNSAGMRLLEIYKSLSIYTEITNLQKQLSQQTQQQPPQQFSLQTKKPSTTITAPQQATLNAKTQTQQQAQHKSLLERLKKSAN